MPEIVRPSDAVLTQWERLDEELAATSLDAMQELIRAVKRSATLGVLYPFFSVGRLCLSRCIDYPYYVDVVLSAGNEGYLVETTVGQGGWAETAGVGKSQTPEGAVQLAESVLPPKYGAARAGNADSHRTEFNDVARLFRNIVPSPDIH